MTTTKKITKITMIASNQTFTMKEVGDTYRLWNQESGANYAPKEWIDNMVQEGKATITK